MPQTILMLTCAETVLSHVRLLSTHIRLQVGAVAWARHHHFFFCLHIPKGGEGGEV